MAIEVTRELFKVDQLVGEELSQSLVEGEIAVSEGQPDIARILDVSGTVYVTGKEVIQDKVMVEGIIRYNLLYVTEGDDRPITSTESEVNFTHYIEVAGAKPNMAAKIKINVEHIDFEPMGNRRVSVKAVVNMECRVSQVLQLEAVQGFKGDTEVQALKERIRVTATGGEGSGQTIIRDDLEIPDNMPSIVEILKKNAQIRVVEKKVADNKVIAHGEIALKLLYLCGEEDAPLQVFEQQIPFSHFVEIPGAYQGMDCMVDVGMQEFEAVTREDINGERRIIGIEMLLSMTGMVFETEDKEIIMDAYTPGKGVNLKKRKIDIRRTVGENQVQTVVKENITLPDSVPSATRIVYVESNALVTDYRISEEKVAIEGVLVANIIYQSEEGDMVFNSYKTDVPFAQSIDIEGITEDMECESQVTAVHSSSTLIAPDEVELKVVLATRAAAYQSVEKEVLLGIELVEAELKEDYGIFVYFVRPGDSLWSIAKRYNTTIANILKYNDVENQDQLVPGTRMIIYKKLDTSIA